MYRGLASMAWIMFNRDGSVMGNSEMSLSVQRTAELVSFAQGRQVIGVE